MAQRADPHRLYEVSVQGADGEVDFADSTFIALRGHPATVLREDFCGTGAVACQWARIRQTNLAIGVDIDPSVLRWGREHNVARLDPEERARVTFLQADVSELATDPADIVLAMNYSYSCFKTRDRLRRYFKNVLSGLNDRGLFILDAFGGSECLELREDCTDHGTFTYIWDQARYDPISGAITCYVHFEFPDGSRLDRAFVYDWRLWTLPELTEILKEAGFVHVTVYWAEDEHDDGEITGYLPRQHGDPDPRWIAHLVAEK